MAIWAKKFLNRNRGSASTEQDGRIRVGCISVQPTGDSGGSMIDMITIISMVQQKALLIKIKFKIVIVFTTQAKLKLPETHVHV